MFFSSIALANIKVPGYFSYKDNFVWRSGHDISLPTFQRFHDAVAALRADMSRYYAIFPEQGPHTQPGTGRNGAHHVRLTTFLKDVAEAIRDKCVQFRETKAVSVGASKLHKQKISQSPSN